MLFLVFIQSLGHEHAAFFGDFVSLGIVRDGSVGVEAR